MSSWKLPASDHEKSRLIALPPELRLRIFRMLLLTSRYPGLPLPPRIRGRYARKPSGDSRPILHPQILVTCQLLCQEGTRVLYEENTVFLDLVDITERTDNFPPGDPVYFVTLLEGVHPSLSLSGGEPPRAPTTKFLKFKVALNFDYFAPNDGRRINYTLLEMLDSLSRCLKKRSKIWISVKFTRKSLPTELLFDTLNCLRILRCGFFRIRPHTDVVDIPQQLMESIKDEVMCEEAVPQGLKRLRLVEKLSRVSTSTHLAGTAEALRRDAEAAIGSWSEPTLSAIEDALIKNARLSLNALTVELLSLRS